MVRLLFLACQKKKAPAPKPRLHLLIYCPMLCRFFYRGVCTVRMECTPSGKVRRLDGLEVMEADRAEVEHKYEQEVSRGETK